MNEKYHETIKLEKLYAMGELRDKILIAHKQIILNKEFIDHNKAHEYLIDELEHQIVNFKDFSNKFIVELVINIIMQSHEFITLERFCGNKTFLPKNRIKSAQELRNEYLKEKNNEYKLPSKSKGGKKSAETRKKQMNKKKKFTIEQYKKKSPSESDEDFYQKMKKFGISQSTAKRYLGKKKP